MKDIARNVNTNRKGLSSVNSDGVEKMIGIGLSKIKFRLS